MNRRASGGFSWPVILIGLLVVASIGGVVAWQSGFNPFAEEEEEKEEQFPVELAQADIATVALSSLSRSLPVTGSLSPLVQTTVKAQAPGEVMEVTVREGQAVKRGEVLVRIDTRNLQAEFASQQAALDKARADLELAKLNRDNNKNLLEKRVVSQNVYDTAESTYKASLAGVKAAEAQLSLARIALEYATVHAPFDGTISARLVEPGERVNIDSELLAIVDLSQLELEAPAPADQVPSVKVGQTAKFRVGGFEDRVFEGRVQRINPMTDTGSRSIMLYLSVDNPDGVLRGGMFAQGDLIVDATDPVAAIPLSAVRTEAGVPYVLSIEGAKLVRRHVTLGMRSEEQNLVEVRSGLDTGERVIAARIDTLKDGSEVVLPKSIANRGDSASAGPAKL